MKRRDLMKAIAVSPYFFITEHKSKERLIKKPLDRLSFCEELAVADIEDGTLKEVENQVMSIAKQCVREGNFSVPTKNPLVNKWLKGHI